MVEDGLRLFFFRFFRFFSMKSRLNSQLNPLPCSNDVVGYLPHINGVVPVHVHSFHPCARRACSLACLLPTWLVLCARALLHFSWYLQEEHRSRATPSLVLH